VLQAVSFVPTGVGYGDHRDAGIVRGVEGNIREVG
jgi:hypothetical protein